MPRCKPISLLPLLSLICGLVGLPSSKAAKEFSATEPIWADQLYDWIEAHYRADAGYAWDGQSRPHLTPTHAAIGSLQQMGRPMPPAQRESLIAWVQTHHPHDLKPLQRQTRRYLFDQLQSLHWLGAETTSFQSKFLQLNTPVAYPKQYEKNGSPYLPSETAVMRGHALLQLNAPETQAVFRSYFDARQRANGTYNHTLARDGSEGHVINTWAVLNAWHELGHPFPASPVLIKWLQDCQLPNGGFTYAPGAPLGGVDDIAYTHAAVHTLALLGAKPRDVAGCQRYLASLWSPGGGFSDRPSWQPNLPATRLALETASSLDQWRSLPIDASPTAPPRVPEIPADLKVFSIQIEAHGTGSVADAVEMARLLRIHLWGAKNASGDWIARAQARADREQVPVTFFAANEEYGTWVTVPGLGTYSHTSDIMFPTDQDPGPSLAKQGVVSWETFRDQRLAPLQQAQGRLFWQFGENEEFVRAVMDDSLARGGFAAISTFHFGNPDFLNSESFMLRYRGQIPFVALQDAHGPEPWWWSDAMAGYRTVFLARNPTWEGWLEALQHHRVASVRHDRTSQFETWAYAGSHAVQQAIFAQSDRWQWWDQSDHPRPLYSLVELTPEDHDELGRPEHGIALRLRLAHTNNSRGRPREPLAELISLTIDDLTIEVRETTIRDPQSQDLNDVYHLALIDETSQSPHKVTVTARDLSSGEIKTTTRWIGRP
jgi:hypothetical protein